MKSIALVTILLFAPSVLGKVTALPEPLKLVDKQGGKIVNQFEAPGDIKGFVADFKGQVVTLYVTADDKYLFTGSMLDAKGNNIGEQAMQAYITGPKSTNDWKLLKSTHWIADGSPFANRIIYTFTDPNCPYCKKLWKNARPWVENGHVQLRHIIVGILKADSLGKAAAILSASDPANILNKHEAGNLFPELKAIESPSSEINKKLAENHQAMIDLGVSATPATFYRDTTGAVKKQRGLPPESVLHQIFGPLKKNE
ncbi:thiol:disulfide interchange protein DsbG [Paraglaciecola mesophila KMM 241]|uniref:Thiol:disulfide interchange protein n=1 Tax=Paraglaciecola mesophila KMM 241 TaxID=1128912 RepID=K6Z890_9ALTE|nr:thiol:disulfide interchange protein DsbG [Paraglaciecola mesophila]GAC26602.1 thiol:disulfide interchange protein DsbG [Paraglaciecola mesophila KMM 241]